MQDERVAACGEVAHLFWLALAVTLAICSLWDRLMTAAEALSPLA